MNLIILIFKCVTTTSNWLCYQWLMKTTSKVLTVICDQSLSLLLSVLSVQSAHCFFSLAIIPFCAKLLLLTFISYFLTHHILDLNRIYHVEWIAQQITHSQTFLYIALSRMKSQEKVLLHEFATNSELALRKICLCYLASFY